MIPHWHGQSRSEVDESRLDPSVKLALELVFPYKHLAMMDTDIAAVVDMAWKLKKVFSTEELRETANRLTL